MNVGHASVHPVEDPPTTEGANGPRVRMKDRQGMPATLGGLALRFFQFVFAAAALCVMATTSDFPSVTAFCYLVAASGLQSIWSFSLAVVDIYALLVGRSLQNYQVVLFFAMGDGQHVHRQALQSLSTMISLAVPRTTACSLKLPRRWHSLVGLLLCRLFFSIFGRWRPDEDVARQD